jgi:hypothetical protein
MIDEMLRALTQLADQFDAVAVPEHGRCVAHERARVTLLSYLREM